MAIMISNCARIEVGRNFLVQSPGLVKRGSNERLSRRLVLLTPVLLGSVALRVNAAEVASDLNSSPLFQELLRKTEENREKRAQERLNDYNKRNFKEYFTTQLNSRVLSAETKEKIKKWLEENEN